MKVLFTLTSSEAKRLIAKGVRALPEVQKALAAHTVIIAGGTTNAYVAEELLGIRIEDKKGYTVGIVTDGETGLSKSTNRVNPYVLTRGEIQAKHWRECLPDLAAGDVFIKGGNAVDHTGLAAVMVSDRLAGTIGSVQGILYARGIRLIVPIGLEKMVPDVRTAVEFMAASNLDDAIGQKVQLVPLLGAKLVTELTTLEALYQVKASCVASGGVAGSEGATTLAVEGNDAEVMRCWDDIKLLKGEAPIL